MHDTVNESSVTTVSDHESVDVWCRNQRTCGRELGPFIISSNHLQRDWKAIEAFYCNQQAGRLHYRLMATRRVHVDAANLVLTYVVDLTQTPWPWTDTNRTWLWWLNGAITHRNRLYQRTFCDYKLDSKTPSWTIPVPLKLIFTSPTMPTILFAHAKARATMGNSHRGYIGQVWNLPRRFISLNHTSRYIRPDNKDMCEDV